MSSRRKYTDEFKREAVRLTEVGGVPLAQVARERGIRANMLGRWRHELIGSGQKAFPGQGNPCDEEMAALKRELARVKKERDFYGKRQRSSRRGHHEVSDDRALPRRLSSRPDVPLPEGITERLPRLAQSPGESSSLR